MKKQTVFTAWLLVTALSLGIFIGTLAEPTQKEITAYLNSAYNIDLNGSRFEATDENGTAYVPVVYNDRIYLPLRAIGNAVGVSVDWDEATQTAKLTSPNTQQVKTAKNVIYMIGDGMGLYQAQISQWKGLGPKQWLAMQQMPVTGIISTYSADNLVTDSAAAGTALSSGFKTNNSVVGLDPDGKKVKNILEAAREQGKSTGLVATSTITDATPASFSAHASGRTNVHDIASQIATCGAEVILGGGRADFTPTANGGSRIDGRNLLDEMASDGYTAVRTRAEMNSFMMGRGKKLVGLFKPGNLETKYPLDPAGLEPTIENMTRKAIDVLKDDPNGFVLMVEGSKIDKMAHSNDSAAMIHETLLFDNAVRAAVEFAKQDGNTIVIVTADHETGGISMPDKVIFTGDEMTSDVKWSTGGHSPAYVPLYAYGCGAELFTGVYDNTQISRKLADILELKNFPMLEQ